jgi:hypothetical protein
MQIKGRFLISLLQRDLSYRLTRSRLQNTNLPAKLNKRDPNRSRGLPVSAGYLAAEAPQCSSMSATDPRSSGAIWASS